VTYFFLNNLWLQGYINMDWANYVNTQKSMSSYIFLLKGKIISWQCHKQMTMALFSTKKCSYITIASIIKKAIWLKQLFQDLVSIPTTMPKPFTLFCDNQSYILLTKNSHFHDYTKHIELGYHFLHKRWKIKRSP
jgi:hypothetical protein